MVLIRRATGIQWVNVGRVAKHPTGQTPTSGKYTTTIFESSQISRNDAQATPSGSIQELTLPEIWLLMGTLQSASNSPKQLSPLTMQLKADNQQEPMRGPGWPEEALF